MMALEGNLREGGREREGTVTPKLLVTEWGGNAGNQGRQCSLRLFQASQERQPSKEEEQMEKGGFW